jgi:Tol biopolymer transport system component/DNA-binding winged helix-turn-helix (wHTH) protein
VVEFESLLGVDMDNGGRSAQTVRFGVFEADLKTGELHRNGIRVALQGQPFQVCAILLEHPGELVTREELRQRVWPEDTFVDFDQALNAAVAKVRIALGDEASNPRFIETLPRRGYRFIAPIGGPSSQPLPPCLPKTGFEGLRARARWTSAGAILLALLCGAGVWWFGRHQAAPPPLPPIEVVPLTGMPGAEYSPAFSPDGNQVAFGLDSGEDSGIYTTLVGGEKPLRLTSNCCDCCPTWSPDGRQVAFSRLSDGTVAIYVVPALGGSERRLYQAPLPPFCHGLDWSPDGKVLAYADTQADKTHTWIGLLSPVDSTTRRLTSPSGQEVDNSPAFSPDGSTVAFVRGIVAGVVSDIYVVPTAGGSAKRLTFDNTWIDGSPSWTPDGREIVFSSTRGGLAGLWRVSASGGTPRPVAGVGAVAIAPSVSRKGNQLVYQQMFSKSNLWRLSLQDETHAQGPPVVVRSEKGANWRPNFSPDGKRFVFESDRFGYPEIWTCDRDGSRCGQLTSLRGTAGAARWSPDGRYIAFEFRPKEHSEVYLLEVGGGSPRLLSTLPGADNGGPNWSRDGKSIYFYSDRGGSFQLWKMQLNGEPPVQVTKNGGVFAAESVDDRFLYYSKFEAPGIWRMPLPGGEEIHILDQPAGDDWSNWAITRNGIYFLDSTPGPKAAVKFFHFATGRTITISTFGNSPSIGLAVSPDGRSILYHQTELAESSLVLVKNFR